MGAVADRVSENEELSQQACDAVAHQPGDNACTNWESWAVSAAGAFFGAPYLSPGTAHAAWAGFLRGLRIRLPRQ